MPYSKKNLEDGVEFDVNPNPAPSAIKQFLIATSPVLILVLLFSSLLLFIILAGIITGIAFLVEKSGKYTHLREKSSFHVNEMGVTKSDTFYDANDIHRILYKNPISNVEYIPMVSARPSNAATVHGLESYFKQQQKLAAVSYQVDIESNGTPVNLCGGLTEAEAHAILTDIGKILKLK